MRPARKSYCHCFCRSNAQPSDAPGSSRWWMRERFSTRFAGRRRKRSGFSVTQQNWSAPVSSSACPANWRTGRPPRPQVTATIGTKEPPGLDTDALLDFRMELTLDGEKLTQAEVKEMLAASNGLALLRGKWVEVDSDRLERMMDRFKDAERLASKDGLSFAKAMRMLAGANVGTDGVANEADPTWSKVVAGPLARRDHQGDCARPMNLRSSIPAVNFTELCATTKTLGSVGCICSRLWGSVLALRTTWGSARASRYSRCCSCFAVRKVIHDGQAYSWPQHRYSPTGPPKSSALRRV